MARIFDRVVARPPSIRALNVRLERLGTRPVHCRCTAHRQQHAPAMQGGPPARRDETLPHVAYSRRRGRVRAQATTHVTGASATSRRRLGERRKRPSTPTRHASAHGLTHGVATAPPDCSPSGLEAAVCPTDAAAGRSPMGAPLPLVLSRPCAQAKQRRPPRQRPSRRGGEWR